METRYINLTGSLNETYLRKVFTNPLKIYGSNQTSRFKDSLFCVKLISEGFRPFDCCFFGAFNIEKVVLAESSINFLDPKSLKHVSSLRFLDLSKNILGDAFSKDDYVKATIANLYRLEVFIVSDNGIFMIPDDAFESGQNLKTLDLSDNKLATVTFKTEYLVSLRKLDLSNNKIKVIDEITLYRLKNLELQTINYTNVENAGIKMSGNPLGCVCDDRQYIVCVLTRNGTASCILDEKEMQIDEYRLRKVDFHCKETIVIVVYSVLMMTEVLVTSLFVGKKGRFEQEKNSTRNRTI